MKRLLVVVLMLCFGLMVTGCGNGLQMDDWGIMAYEVYTEAICDSPFWPDGVTPLTTEQKKAFASTSWYAHAWVIAQVQDAVDDD